MNEAATSWYDPFVVMKTIAAMDSGQRSRLRRGERGTAFWQVWSRANCEKRKKEDHDGIARFIFAVAQLVGTRPRHSGGIHDTVGLGQTLVKAGISTARFETMIHAPLEIRRDLLDRMVKRIATAGLGANINHLSELYEDEEPSRMFEICRSFYLNAPQNEDA